MKKSGKYVLFCVDASAKVGIGHLMRCLAFARQFSEYGFKNIFALREYDKKVLRSIKNSGYEVTALPKAVTFAEYSRRINGLISAHGIRLVFTDLSYKANLANTAAYAGLIHSLKRKSLFLITIDGFGDECASARTAFASDIVIIPYLGAKSGKRSSSCGSRYLLGSKYFVFRKEFIEASKTKKNVAEEAKRLLITMGGSDPFDITVKAVGALLKLDQDRLNIKIVIGDKFRDSVRRDIGKMLKNYNGRWQLVPNTDRMAKLMMWADVGIFTSGLTKYEAALMGLPAVIISMDHGHEALMDEFEKSGCCLHVGSAGNVNEDYIAKGVNRLLSKFDTRVKMSRAGRNIVDGKAFNRIISEIPKEYLYE